VLKHQAYRAMPWRNGRGTTREIAREPATGAQFAWRLSLADIETDGDFSAYPGYSRAIVLVAGNALRLKFRRRGDCCLSPARRGTRFEGDWQTSCALPDGRCTDLSLIVRKGSAARPAFIVRAPRVLRLKSARSVVLSGDLYGALHVLAGSVGVTASVRARARALRAADTALFFPGARRNLTLRNLGRSAAQLVLLRWRPGPLGR
jgi:uncharacterized protein